MTFGVHIHALADQYVVSNSDPASTCPNHGVAADVGMLTDMEKTRCRSPHSTAAQPQVAINACVASDLDPLPANTIEVGVISNCHMVTRYKETRIQETRIFSYAKIDPCLGTAPSQHPSSKEFQFSFNRPP
jgi:hypothetical protein